MGLLVLGFLILIALLYAPQAWAQWVLKRYSKERDDFPGTGGQFARHLIRKLDLKGVGVEETDQGDHYDPETRMVRLTPNHFHGKSLTAVTVAAHEVGHAHQHHHRYRPLEMRSRMVRQTHTLQKVGSVLLMAMPVAAAVLRAPFAMALMVLGGIASMGIGVIVHLVTLPVEYDASFNRALPILEQGRYIPKKDQRAARRILKACALTYVASSLSSLLSFWRWFSILFRR